jgi:hypothetical protein
MKDRALTGFFLFFLFLISVSFVYPEDKGSKPVKSVSGFRKVKDIVIYSGERFYSSFPSVVKRPDGELIVAFRRAPDRQAFGEKGNSHVDPNSYLVMVRSRDGGTTWTKEPELIFAFPFGGSQDPCLLQMKDGSLICSSYAWTYVRPDGVSNLKVPVYNVSNGFIFMGGYYVISKDGGNTWAGPYFPPHISSEVNFTALGDPLPAYNRGALCEGRDGRIFWVVAATDRITPHKTSNFLLISDDKGLSFRYSCPVAVDEKVTFNEASAYETPRGDVLAFIRTAGFDDHACIARSTDGGKSFQKWEDMGFQGHPLNAIRLPDNRVLLSYGYRHPPYGIRARILNAECTDYKAAPEIILRDDGGSTDLGYTWPVLIDRKHVLVVYYFNIENGIRHIAGTILESD